MKYKSLAITAIPNTASNTERINRISFSLPSLFPNFLAKKPVIKQRANSKKFKPVAVQL